MSSPTERADLDCVVVGAGVFGCFLALHLTRELGLSVAVLEREVALLRRASFTNQARVHNGYHYPRSILTGLRSRLNSARFLREYAECVDTTFAKYYAVARERSNVTAAQFEQFCARIGAPLAPAEPHAQRWFDMRRIERVWRTQEWAFDADALAKRMGCDLAARDVPVLLRHNARRVRSLAGARRLELEYEDLDSGRTHTVAADHVFNATYSDLNGLLTRSGAPKLALKQEVTEIALVETPEEFRRVGVTVMCGPFFSFMPFPALGLHSLSHVRYTPHRSWQDREVEFDNQEFFRSLNERSNCPQMMRDSARFVPAVAQFRQRDALMELKTVLPQSEQDDSRPILFHRHPELPGLVSVLGGKVDNIYDLERELAPLRIEQSSP